MRGYIGLFFIAGLLGTTGCSQDKVVAEFRGGKITLKELEKKLDALYPHFKARALTFHEKKALLEQLIEEKLILKKAEEEGIDRDPEILQRVESYRENLIRNKMREKIFSEVGDVTEDELRKYYESNIYAFTTPEKYCLKRIGIKDKNKGTKILNDLKKNKIKFEDALKYSEDPLTKTMEGKMGCMRPYDRLIFHLRYLI